MVINPEFNLNDPRNLNQPLNPLPTTPPPITPENKKQVIKRWNDKPENKGNGIKAVDEKSYNWTRRLAIVGVIAFIVLVAAVVMVAVTIWNDGTLLDSIELVCGDNTCSEIPECPLCPNCDVACGDSFCPEFPDTINIFLNNETE